MGGVIAILLMVLLVFLIVVLVMVVMKATRKPAEVKYLADNSLSKDLDTMTEKSYDDGVPPKYVEALLGTKEHAV